MKKLISAMFCICLVAAILFGCFCDSSQNTATPTVSPISQDATSPFILDIIDTLSAHSKMLPDQILAKTDECTVYRKDGHCFLDFKSGNQKVSMDITDKDSCGHAMIFDSMEELCQWLDYPVFTGNTEEGIRHCFPLNSENGFYVPDPENLYILDLPDEYHLQSVSIRGERFELVYKTHEPLPTGRNGGILIQFIDKDLFAYDLARYYRFQRGNAPYNNTYRIEENSATVYEYESFGNKCRDIQYCLETDAQTLFVAEHYIRISDHTGDDYRLASIDIFGSAHGVYFRIGPHYSSYESLRQVINALKIVEYAP